MILIHKCTADIYTFLHAEKAGHEVLGGEALRIHIDIADGCGQLAPLSHRSNKRLLGEDSFLGVLPNSIRRNRRKGYYVVSRLLGTLPETTHCREDTFRHLSFDIPNGMQMVGHQLVMKNLNFGFWGIATAHNHIFRTDKRRKTLFRLQRYNSYNIHNIYNKMSNK